MKHELDVDEFIDALIAARKLLMKAQEWDQQQTALQASHDALRQRIAELNAQEATLRNSVCQTRTEVNEALRQQRAVADHDLETYRGTIEAAKHDLSRSLADMNRTTQEAIRKSQAEGAAAAQMATTARQDLKSVQDALAKSYADVEALSKRVAGVK